MSNVRVIHPAEQQSLADAEQDVLDALANADHAEMLSEIPWAF